LSESLTAMGLTPVFENEVAAIYAQGDGATLKKFPGAVLAGEQVLTDPGRLTVALSQLETTAVLISLPSGGQDELETVLSSKNLAASGRINAREGGDEF